MHSNIQPRWIATSAPVASRYDDLSFISDTQGWAVNSNGEILMTLDGGHTWTRQLHEDQHWFRSITVGQDNGRTKGWVGSMIEQQPLFGTDDGCIWKPTTNLPSNSPVAVCGLWSNASTRQVVAVGDNYPHHPSRVLGSEDGGHSWWTVDISTQAKMIVDVVFTDQNTGWLTGGTSDAERPPRTMLHPVILKTTDGGRTWTDVLKGHQDLVLGEWGWKIQKVSADLFVVSCESYTGGALFISSDGGHTWRRQAVADAAGKQINTNLEGVGFIDEHHGWVGGWGDRTFQSGRTSVTFDGGKTWRDETSKWPRPFPGAGVVTASGQYINRFQFIHSHEQTIGYAAGRTIYKYTADPNFDPPDDEFMTRSLFASTHPLEIQDALSFEIFVPRHTSYAAVDIFDRFAGHVANLWRTQDPYPGPRRVHWKPDVHHSRRHQYIVRVTCDQHSESRMAMTSDTWSSLKKFSTSVHQP